MPIYEQNTKLKNTVITMHTMATHAGIVSERKQQKGRKINKRK